MTGRERILTLLDGGAPDRAGLMPITMMFAAGRASLDYGRYALDYRILVESQLRTAGDYGLDHVSAITETREAPDCGAPIRFFDNQPYALDEERSLLADKTVLARLPMPSPQSGVHMNDRLLAIDQLKRRAGSDLIVEGWVEGPCGAAADLRGINRLMLDFHDDPAFVGDLFEFVLTLAISFGKAQVASGADVIGIGDPAASLVGPRLYDQFVWTYQKRLVDALHAAGARVRLHICGNTRRVLAQMGRLGCEIVDIDSMVPLAEARAAMGPDQVLLGGIDPVRVIQDGSPADVAKAVEDCFRQAGPRYIAGGGCEIPALTPHENMLALARAARPGDQ
ncbi:MAG TPA: uroporphyrinogen decarboxylase family protein [Bryobacteraceae bacterium]|nr:uroporphyrinogen decarboxylase family protein [Bryobacteraceae bacterium]HPT27306.1 uroporphyrinogen decarboxylase family protein [Bryobacteraceae bacterium]